MRASNLNKADLESALRTQASLKEVSEVEEARLERSCTVSVIQRSARPKVLDTRVAEGVQTVRLKLD